MRTRPADLVLPALIGANLAVKLLWLGTNELSHDEPFTVMMAHRTWADLFGQLAGENNPPLHFVLMKLWAAVVPLDAAWLRVPSAVFSALTVWPLFLLARSLGGLRMALIAALLFTFNTHLFGLGHEVRAYSLFALLAVTATWQLWRMAHRQRRSGLWYAVVAIPLVYTHFFGWLVVGLHLLFVLLLADIRPARKRFLQVAGLVLVSYLPYATTFIGRLGTSVEHGTWLVAPEPDELYNMIWRWTNAPVLAVGALLIILIAVVRTKGRGTAVQLGLLWAFVPLFGMFLVSFVVPIFLDRYLVYAAPGFHLLLAVCAVQAFGSGRWSVVPAALLVGGTAVTFQPWRSNGLHPSQVVAQAEAWRGTGPVLLFPPWYADTYAWHAERDLVRDPERLYRNLGMGFIHPVEGVADLPIDLGGTDSLVLVDAWGALTDPNARLKSSLRQAYPRVDSTEADRKVWVYRFAR